MKLSTPEIRIASPCKANWDEMTGDEKVRFCGQCQKHVYNLSALTAEASAALVRAKEGKFCARFYQRPDGTLLHAEDCPVGFAARQWRRVRHGAGAVVSVLLLFLGVNRAQAGEPAGGGKKPPAKEPADLPVMGKICVVPPSPTPTPKPTATPKPGEKP
jgi:hypothetical protein